jgi:serum/glucocorticoid-regulated kinase 2
VRTDDLESVRVERAIRRVRSDVAAHMSSPSTVNVTMHNSSVLHDTKRESRDDNFTQDTGPSPSLDDSEGVPSPMLDDTASSTSASARSVIEIEASDNGSVAQPTTPSSPSSPLAVKDTASPPVDQAVVPPPSTPVATEYPSRIPRSQSADPDKAARLSRVYTPSDTSVRISGTGTETTSASASATEDDSPLNPSRDGRERKKRSKSSRRAKERVSRKVQVSDFEMMRVLGKGCAGKVLLVRHKSSSDLYALKAITKRHVLAHQELQHTLTEQAVLRRMAGEGTDPFVVKLWWSFHDKENLFLVMVRLAYNTRNTKRVMLICVVTGLPSWR